MSDKESSGPGSWGLLKKGYTPTPVKGGIAQDGFIPAAGQLGKPPTQGSAVMKPAQSKKD